MRVNLLGMGELGNNKMEWTFLNPPLVEEYGAQHRIFKKPGKVCYPIQISLLGKASLALNLKEGGCSETETDSA